MFYSYAICLGDTPYYYGFGSSDYGDGRGRIEEHQTKLRMASNGVFTRNHLYHSIQSLATRLNLSVTFKKYYEGESELEALTSESNLIENHSKLYTTPLINRRIGGKVISEDTSLRVLNMTVPEDGYEMWKHKWKLKLHERKLRKLHLFDLADKFAEKYKELKVLTTGKVNATLAVQRATRLALKKGYVDIVDNLSMSRASNITLEEHRDHVTLALETMKVREIISQPVPEDPDMAQDYMEKLKYNEKRYNELGMFTLGQAVSGRLLHVRKTCIVGGIKCLKTNANIIDDLQNQPDLLKMSG